MQEAENKQLTKKWTFAGIWRKLLSYTEAKLAFKTGLAASISLMAGMAFSKLYDRPDMFVSGLWSVMASIVVMQANLGGTYKAAWVRFLGVIVGSIAGAILIDYIGSTPLSLAVSVFCTIVICSLLNLKESFRIAGMSTAIIIIMGASHPVLDPWTFSLYRFLDSCIGILVAVFIAQVLWPEKALEKMRANISKTLDLLSKYYLIATKIEPEGKPLSSMPLAVEIDNLLQENREDSEEAEMELFENKTSHEHSVLLGEQLQTIFDSLWSLDHVHKSSLANIFDDSLATHATQVIDNTANAFLSLEKAFAADATMPTFEELSSSLQALSDDLSRFRATRTTRKFSLEDVESFYVFFYSLRVIGNAVIKMSKQST